MRRYRCFSFSLRYFLLLIVLLFFLLFSGCAGQGKKAGEKSFGGYTVVDARGDKVHIPKKPKRIMTSAFATDEICLGLVKPERMIAINKDLASKVHSPHICELATLIPHKIPRNLSVEMILDIKPDLMIVSSYIPIDMVETLRNFGIPTVVCNSPRSYKEIVKTVKFIAECLDEKERGDKLIAKMEEKLADICRKIENQPEEKKGKSVAIMAVMVSYGNGGTLADDICRFAGAKNAKALYGLTGNQAITKEQLIECNPDYLFFVSFNDPNTKLERMGHEFMTDPSVAVMKAVKEKHICFPYARYVHNLSQNFVYGVQEAAYYLYGDEFKQSRTHHLSVAE